MTPPITPRPWTAEELAALETAQATPFGSDEELKLTAKGLAMAAPAWLASQREKREAA